MNTPPNRTRAEKTKGRSLSVVVDLWVGSAFIIAMTVCAGVEYMRNPDIPLSDLLSHHLLGLFLFGLLLWAISWLMLRIVLIQPIRRIYLDLYRIGGGDHSPLVVNTGVREIQEIVEAINIMLWRMEQQTTGIGVNGVHEEVVASKETAGGAQ